MLPKEYKGKVFASTHKFVKKIYFKNIAKGRERKSAEIYWWVKDCAKRKAASAQCV